MQMSLNHVTSRYTVGCGRFGIRDFSPVGKKYNKRLRRRDIRRQPIDLEEPEPWDVGPNAWDDIDTYIDLTRWAEAMFDEDEEDEDEEDEDDELYCQEGDFHRAGEAHA